MTTPVDSSTAGSASTAASSAVDPTSQINSNTFLQLMVDQLKYQDPDSPADSSQFLAQTAQFTSVDKLTSMDTSLTALLAQQETLSATSMLGRQVTWDGGTGIVSGVNNTAAGPVLSVGTGSDAQSVDLSAVTTVTAAPASTTGA